MNQRPQTNRSVSNLDKSVLTSRLSGLARTHRLILIERNKEIQFLKLCEQIRINDLKRLRADRQRDDRKEKRLKKIIVDPIQ